MKRAVAHAVLYFSCLSSFATSACCAGADLNSSWLSLGQAKIKKNIRATTAFRPELTLEQNNQILRQHRAQAVIVSSTVPTHKLTSLQIVNRAASWQVENQNFAGRITAVMLSEDQRSVTVFAEITDSSLDHRKLADQASGVLSIEG